MMPLSDPAEAELVLHQRALRPQLRFIPEAPWTNADRGPPWARCVVCINVVSLGATLQWGGVASVGLISGLQHQEQ